MSLEAMLNLCEQRIEQEEAALERKRQLEHSLSDTGDSHQKSMRRACLDRERPDRLDAGMGSGD